MPNEHPGIGGLQLCFGGNVFGWTLDRDRSFEMLDAFYERGGRMIDTAEVYSVWAPGNKGGESETIIGEWLELRGVRKDILLATKTLHLDKTAEALEGSLERLRTDYVDIYYAHRDEAAIPLDEVVAGFGALAKAGKARELGASNYTAERLTEAVALAESKGLTPFTVLQPEYNLVSRGQYEGAVQDFALARGIAVLPYFALASGFLTGKFRKPSDWEGTSRADFIPGFVGNGGFETLRIMDGIAAETGATLSQIALAWIIAQPGIAAPIASATSIEQLDNLVKGVSLQLSAEHIERLNAAG